jgi:hypothetical protein
MSSLINQDTHGTNRVPETSDEPQGEQSPRDVDWLVHLAINIPRLLPKIRRVVLRETLPQHFTDWHVAKWSAPPVLEDLFERAGVELEVWLRIQPKEEMSASVAEIN